MKILCFGDSLTFGYGISKKYSWVELLNNNFNKIDFINNGINGDTTTGMLSRISNVLMFNNYNKIIIMGGTNDFLQNKNPNSVKDNLILLIKECLDKNIEPYLLIPPLILNSLAKTFWSEEIDYINVNEKMLLLKYLINKEIEDNHLKINVIDLSSIVPLQTEFYIDGIHLSIKGNSLIFDIIKNIYLHK